MWTYEELNNAAVIQIERCRKQAAVLFSDGDGIFARRYAEWAYGVCELWLEQTKAHHMHEDRERLIGMVKTVELAAVGKSLN